MGLGGKDSKKEVCNATSDASWWQSAFMRKQNRRSSDAWVQPSAVKEIVAKREPLAFLSDEEITSSWVFKITQWFWLTYAAILHDLTCTGVEKLPKDKPALLVGPHTFHSTDVFVGAMMGQRVGGKVIHGLVHRMVLACAPWLRLLGLFPGRRDTAIAMLKENNWCACIPGGIEEIMEHTTGNGEHAYEIWWRSHNQDGHNRKGFAEVALQMGPGFKVFPFFFENGEEMKWNPIFELWCYLRLDKLYGAVMRSLPAPLEWLAWHTAILVTFNLSLWTSIPIPVKITFHVGDGVEVREGDTAQEFADRLHEALQDLADVKQGRRHRSYSDALRQPFARSFFQRLVGDPLSVKAQKPARHVCFATEYDTGERIKQH